MELEQAKPFWNGRCDDAVSARNEALRAATAPNHSREDVERHNNLRREADRVIREEETAFARDQISAMGADTDMWNFLKRMDGRRQCARPAATIVRATPPGHPVRLDVTDSQKAKLFAASYSAVSRIPKNKADDRETTLSAKRAVKKCSCRGERSDICRPFTPQELDLAIAKLRKGKAPGADGITNDMLHQLSSLAKHHLLHLFNACWESADVPASWRRAEIVAILKKKKNPAVPGSYRPISLLSCISKLFERLLQNRLQLWPEKRNLLNTNQAGFRRKHSSLDQISKVTQSIFDTLERVDRRKSGKAVLVLLDFQKAYDRVWKDGLLSKMGKMGVPAHVSLWVKNFLTDRRARVLWNHSTSKWRVFREGLPQGSVPAPLLWAIYINDIDQNINSETVWSLFADDVALLATGNVTE